MSFFGGKTFGGMLLVVLLSEWWSEDTRESILFYFLSTKS